MGDTKDDKDHTQQITGSITTFYIGETQPRGELPQHLRERLCERKGGNTNKETLIEKEKAQEKRLQDIREKKLQKLREHHEKVKRLAAEKKLRKLQEQEQGKENIEQNGIIENVEHLSRNSNFLNDHYLKDMNELETKSSLRSYYSYTSKDSEKRQYG